MKQFILLALSLFIISCFNKSEPGSETSETIDQNEGTIRVDLNTIYNQSGRGFLIFYPLTQMDDSLVTKIKFPNLSGASDTGFAQIYFTGRNHSALENGILVLVGNYSSKSPILWVDYNNDLNFLNEKEPLQFSEEHIDVSISNLDEPELYHSIRFHKPDSVQGAEAKQMIEKYILKGKPYAGFYFDQRRNIRVGDFVYEQDSMRIGIMDFNVNGSYNDLESDRILIGTYKGAIQGTDEVSGAVVLDTSTYVHGLHNSFKIIDLAENGTSLSIKPISLHHNENGVREGQPISDHSFNLISGEQTSVHDFLSGENYLYLSFWASWCVGCHQEIEDLEHIQANYPEKVKILSLNYNEDIKTVEKFIHRYKVSWTNGFSTSEINEDLFIDGLPRNILIDPSGNIIEMNIHPSALLKQIEDL